jgi:hypothetical protein
MTIDYMPVPPPHHRRYIPHPANDLVHPADHPAFGGHPAFAGAPADPAALRALIAAALGGAQIPHAPQGRFAAGVQRVGALPPAVVPPVAHPWRDVVFGPNNPPPAALQTLLAGLLANARQPAARRVPAY